MPADRPHITSLHEGCFLQSSGQVEIIVLCIAVGFIGEQVSQFLFVKTGHGKIVSEVLQLRQFYGEQLLVPASIKRHAIIRENVRFLLCFGQVVDIDTRHLRDALCLRRLNSAVTCNDIEVAVDDDRIDESEFPQRGA